MITDLLNPQFTVPSTTPSPHRPLHFLVRPPPLQSAAPGTPQHPDAAGTTLQSSDAATRMGWGLQRGGAAGWCVAKGRIISRDGPRPSPIGGVHSEWLALERGKGGSKPILQRGNVRLVLRNAVSSNVELVALLMDLTKTLTPDHATRGLQSKLLVASLNFVQEASHRARQGSRGVGKVDG